MRFFPNIQIVDVLPFTELERSLRDDQPLLGFFNPANYDIYILRVKSRCSIFRSLCHELCHWIIQITTKKEKVMKSHAFFDKINKRFINNPCEVMLSQAKTRKQRYKNVVKG